MSRLEQRFLGIEGGGTKTIAVAACGGKSEARFELGPGNVRLLSEGQLRELLAHVADACPRPDGIGIGMAGVRDETDRKRIRAAVEAVWGKVPVAVTHDLAIALAADDSATKTKVLVLSGTGSCCYGESGQRTEKVGGWGHLLGDSGSGYEIALSALRKVLYQFDRNARWSALGQQILRSLMLNEPGDLISWAQSATKFEIAALAPGVFATARDAISREVLQRTAESLARDAIICGRRLASKSEAAAFVLAGSVLLKQPTFAREVAKRIRKEFPRATVTPLRREAAWGAIELARKVAPETSEAPAISVVRESKYYVPEFSPGSSPTEQRNAASMRFHEMRTAEMVELMLDAEAKTVPALRRAREPILQAVELAAAALKRGGRIFYVGAGTSGRLGILDASECPPTFRASPELIQGIIAGGQRAVWEAVEGAEDDADAGARALSYRVPTAKDLVVGIAASGRTPFVWGAIGLAKKIRAKTILVCFNPSIQIEKTHRPDVVIAPNLGPEILTGSTRLKSGTATKIVLNMISTIAMVRMGKVIGNLMVDLNPSNIKLRDRAVRILRELTDCSPEAAQGALEKSGWVVKDAWVSLKKRKG